MALLTMSERELSRLKIIEDINEQRLSVIQAAPRRTGLTGHVF